MYCKLLFVTALAAAASAQNMTSNMTLPMVLGNNTQLSNLTTFVSLIPNLLTSLSSAKNITLLAPSNDAFAKFMNGSAVNLNDTAAIQALLSYHVLNGTHSASSFTNMSTFIPTMLTQPAFANVTGGQRVEAVMIGNGTYFYSGLGQNSSVTTPDLNFTGGTIHVIDTVLALPTNISSTALDEGLSSAYGALNASGLVNAVDTVRDVTAFIPNNEAFQAIGSALPNMTMAQLSSILTYHIVNGTVGYSSTLMNGSSLTAMNGGKLTITLNNGSVFVNSAQVVEADILVANGVVHVIDGVLNPMNMTATPVVSATTQAPAFASASMASDVPFTSGVPMATTTAAGGAAAGSSAAAASTSSAGAWSPMQTGAIGAAALFAAGNVWLNA